MESSDEQQSMDTIDVNIPKPKEAFRIKKMNMPDLRTLMCYKINRKTIISQPYICINNLFVFLEYGPEIMGSTWNFAEIQSCIGPSLFVIPEFERANKR